MFDFLSTARGLCHFCFDRTPKGLPVVAPKTRHENAFTRDGLPLVAKVQEGADLKASLSELLGQLGGLSQVIKSGDKVVVKPNFNSPDPFPGSTDLAFLKATLELLKDCGAKLIVGESAGGLWRPTRVVAAKLGVPRLLQGLGVDFIWFDDRPRHWVQVEIGGDYLKKAILPASAYEADKLVYLPCLKTHRIGRFSLSLKLAVGFLHPGERRSLHRSHLEEKVAEINLAWQPDLIIMDGRKVFVSGGPDTGAVQEPGLLMASGDLVALDLEALRLLGSYPARNRLLPDPLKSPQIATALKQRLGSNHYMVVP